MRGMMRLAMMGAPGTQGGASGPIEYVNDSPTAIVPTLGDELLVNSDFSAWTDDDPDGWDCRDQSGTDHLITERDSGQLYEDTKTTGGAANFYTNSPNNTMRAQQNVLTPFSWVQFQVVISATSGVRRPRLCNNSLTLSKFCSGTGTHTLRGWNGSGQTYFQLRVEGGGSNNWTADSASAKPVTNVMSAEKSDVPIGSWGYTHFHILADRQAGGYLKYDDNNYIFWFACRAMNKVYLVSCVGGTFTEISSAAITYSDTKAVWWRHDALNTWLIGYDTPSNIEAYAEADFTTQALINVDTVTDTNLNLMGNVYEFGALSTDADNAPQKYYFCGVEGLDGYTTPLPDPNNFSASAAATYLTTPSYDGSGQGIHPDVVKFSSPWNGYIYWMAFTPYPFQNPAYENPSILASNDGDTWVVPDGLTNPIEDAPETGINSDTDLVYNATDNKLYCIWRYTDGATVDVIKARSSSDGVTWSDAVDLLTEDFADALSPALLHDGSQWVMYYYKDGSIIRRTCATLTGTWSAAEAITINRKPAALSLWHHDIIISDGIYYLLLAEARGDLYLAIGDDGVKFTCASLPLLSGGTGAGKWDNQGLYRSTLLKIAGGLDIWYSGMADDNAWHIGRTQAVLSS